MSRRRGVTDRHRGRVHVRLSPERARQLERHTGVEIRHARDEAGLGLDELAAALGVHKSTIVRWESGGGRDRGGRAGIPLWRLYQLAAAFGVPVDHLLWRAFGVS